nr:uncharacterized protein LOC129280420 [Lytechinus pictus]
MLTGDCPRDRSPVDILIALKRPHAQGSWTKKEGLTQVDNSEELQHQEMASLKLGGYYTYLGCFYDNNNRESLPDLIYCERDTYPYDSCQNTCGPQAQYCQSQEMTIELCRDICADQNMRYFGLQAGKQCLCGGFFAPYNALGQPDGNDTCNRPCEGNSSQLCGSDFQVSVYQINESPSDCFNPGYVLNGDQSQQDSSFYNASDVIDFATVCPPPSIKDGAASITCNASGNWTNPPPTCTVRCATPTAPMHANFSSWQTLSDNYAVDDEVFFDCEMDPSRTNQTLTCGYYGDWGTFDPDCPETPPPTNGSTTTNIAATTVSTTVSTTESVNDSSSTIETTTSGGIMMNFAVFVKEVLACLHPLKAALNFVGKK